MTPRDCARIREHLPEHVLGTLDVATAARVERHLSWCAGCRREARELAEGASVMAHASPPAEPQPQLEHRVRRAVAGAARRGRARPRPRLLIAAALASLMLLVGALGWAVAMTGRAARLEDAASTATTRAQEFELLVAEILRDPEQGDVRAAELKLVGGKAGGGRVVISDSPGGYDWALIIAGGLPKAGGPYRAFLMTADGRERLGKLHDSAPGEVAAYRIFERGFSPVRSVWVTNERGRTVLRAVVPA